MITLNRYVTQGIVLTRIDFGEADRIITFLTPDHGKIKTMARGVRKRKSKLAGGIELFSVSDLTILVGKGEIDTIMSSRLAIHYGRIVKDAVATQAGFEFLKLINKATEDRPEPAYFKLLKQTLQSLDNSNLSPQVTALWGDMHLLKLAGHMPDLGSDLTGAKLTVSASYDFHLDAMRFAPKEGQEGNYSTDHIKFLRLGLASANPQILAQVNNAVELSDFVNPLVKSMLKTYFRL